MHGTPYITGNFALSKKENCIGVQSAVRLCKKRTFIILCIRYTVFLPRLEIIDK